MAQADGLIGQTISHYRIIEMFRSGGMETVYKAEDALLHRFVALRFLPNHVAKDPQTLTRFRREACDISSLKHPNICAIYDIREQDGKAFVAMEYLQGSTLKELINRSPIDLEQLLDITIDIADALAVAHAHGIIHRDITPANIFVTESGRVKVLNFGLARVAEPMDNPLELITLMMTRVGSVSGALPYMSPEQAQSQPVDHRTDIFSLGAVIYEMFTGRRPFDGRTSAALTSSLFRDTPAPITQFRADAPLTLQRILERCLAKNLHERYRSIRELQDALEQLRLEISSGIRVGERPKHS
jgi:serine/threonine protein kinase